MARRELGLGLHQIEGTWEATVLKKEHLYFYTVSNQQTVKQPDRQRYLEGIVAHCVDHIFEKYLGGERVSMVDDGLSVGTVPAVHFHASAAATQSPEQQRQIQYFINLLIISI